MADYRIIKISEHKELIGEAAEWFHSKWGIAKELYVESMEESFSSVVPQWYLCLDGKKIAGGLGVIENDFHDRKDLTPNVCAVYTEEKYRNQGIAGSLLNTVCEDMSSHGINTLYLLTNHDSFYERYGWKFLCMAMGDGEEKASRMYVHRMIKTIGIVSLSAGTLGEDFVSHEVKIGLKRLEDYGLKVKFMPNALKGREYCSKHPEKRAEDLLAAFADPEIDMILCAIGGEDTYRLLPYLFDECQLEKAVTDKVFLGYSDSTFNHLMLYKVGLKTFYGQAFLSDVCELDKEMLPYTRQYFEELLKTGTIAKITPSPIWYESREDFSPQAVGTGLPAHENRGFELLQGGPVFSGEILGGCIDSLYDVFDNGRFEDTVEVCGKYSIFPSAEDWKGKILLLESSEETMPPEKYERALNFFKEAGVFSAVNGVLIGKPMNEMYFEEYKSLLKKVIDDLELPVVTNLNVGHALPRCIVPFGRRAVVDVNKQEIKFE